MGIAKDNITAKDQENFVKLVTSGLVEMGAKIQPSSCENTLSHTKFKLDTIAGELTITLYHRQTFLFTVYSIFENVSRAKEKFNCNPYTGKYNIHIPKKHSQGITNKRAVELALMHFECTL
jgi:hypothetical protein